MSVMISKLISLVISTFGRVSGALDKTPVVGRVHRWTVDRVSTSEEAKNLLKKTVYFSMLMIATAVFSTIYFISVGKADLVTSTLLGSIFTLFAGIMTIALSAFATVLSTTVLSSTVSGPPPAAPTGPGT